MSSTVMGTLNVGDYVYVDLETGSIYSDSERQTYFGGFHYHPVEGSQHAWSVYRFSSYASGVDPIDPLPFQVAHVNIPSDLYSFTDHHVHINKSGLYYVHLTVGVQTGDPIEAFNQIKHKSWRGWHGESGTSPRTLRWKHIEGCTGSKLRSFVNWWSWDGIYWHAVVSISKLI